MTLMWLLTLPDSWPWLFWPGAVLWSSVQAYAGYQYGGYIYDHAIKEESRNRRIRRWAYSIPHAGLYVVATAAGFAAWLFLNAVAPRIADVSQLSGGTATALVATGTLGILGISGALGRLLYIGNKFL